MLQSILGPCGEASPTSSYILDGSPPPPPPPPGNTRPGDAILDVKRASERDVEPYGGMMRHKCIEKALKSSSWRSQGTMRLCEPDMSRSLLRRSATVYHSAGERVGRITCCTQSHRESTRRHRRHSGAVAHSAYFSPANEYNGTWAYHPMSGALLGADAHP